MRTSVTIPLCRHEELYDLFPIIEGASLTDQVAHAFNQSLQRDHFFGSWADVYKGDDDRYHLRLSSPTHDLSPYEQTVPDYIAAGLKARAIYRETAEGDKNVQFLLPFGLSMASYTSILLLHYPPTEAFTFQDYIYTDTNRRWECLLADNGFDGINNVLLERMIDIVPLVAPGDASKLIAPYNDKFYDYVEEQLRNFLRARGEGQRTAPIAVGGGPARDFVQDVLAAKGASPLKVGSVVELEIVAGRSTPLICANHPSTFLFFLAPDGHLQPGKQEEAIGVMRQDLIAAGWQAAMAADWQADPHAVYDDLCQRWAPDDLVLAVVEEQVKEFSFYGKQKPA